MSDYDPLFQLPSGTDDIESVFKTGRGSTYAHHSDATTTRNRSGEKHRDTRTGIQQRSGKTVFVAPEHVNSFAGLFQNPDMATQLLPELDRSGKPTGKVQLVLTEDYGPRKAGSVLYTAPYTTKPAVGLNPVEIYASQSPLNDAGRGVHFGNAITEVQPRPAKTGGLGSLLDLDLNEIKRPNGAIGTQGVDPSHIKSILQHVGGLQVPSNATMREMVDAFKANPDAQNRIRQHMLKQPLKGMQLPDDTISIDDGHHRAFLLNQAGDRTIPAEIKGYAGPSKLKNVGKVGIAAALMSALGAAKAGEYGKAAGIVGESMLPLGVTPTELAPGTLSPELKAEQDAYNAQRQAEKKAQVAKQQALLRSGVTLPEEYRRGGRVRMI